MSCYCNCTAASDTMMMMTSKGDDGNPKAPQYYAQDATTIIADELYVGGGIEEALKAKSYSLGGADANRLSSLSGNTADNGHGVPAKHKTS